MTRNLCIIMALAAPLALAGARAQAATVTFSFSGTVASIDDPSGLIGTISPGETFTGSFSYETGVADLNPDLSRGDYLYTPSTTPPFATPLGITFTIGGRTFGPNYSPPGGMLVSVFDDTPSDLGIADAIAASHLTSVDGNPLAGVRTLFGLIDPTRAAFPGAALPDSLDPADFAAGLLELNIFDPTSGMTRTLFSGTIDGLGTAAVPEPASLAMAGLGITGVAGLAIRRKRMA
jgi:hypothetical protein